MVLRMVVDLAPQTALTQLIYRRTTCRPACAAVGDNQVGIERFARRGVTIQRMWIPSSPGVLDSILRLHLPPDVSVFFVAVSIFGPVLLMNADSRFSRFRFSVEVT